MYATCRICVHTRGNSWRERKSWLETLSKSELCVSIIYIYFLEICKKPTTLAHKLYTVHICRHAVISRNRTTIAKFVCVCVNDAWKSFVCVYTYAQIKRRLHENCVRVLPRRNFRNRIFQRLCVCATPPAVCMFVCTDSKILYACKLHDACSSRVLLCKAKLN